MYELLAFHIHRSLTYPDYSLIQTHAWEPNYIYTGSDSFIWIFSYLDSQLGNVGIRISEASL